MMRFLTFWGHRKNHQSNVYLCSGWQAWMLEWQLSWEDVLQWQLETTRARGTYLVESWHQVDKPPGSASVDADSHSYCWNTPCQSTPLVRTIPSEQNLAGLDLPWYDPIPRHCTDETLSLQTINITITAVQMLSDFKDFILYVFAITLAWLHSTIL